MNILYKNFIILTLTCLFISCESGPVILNPSSENVTGDLNGYLKVIEGDYEPSIDENWGSLKISVKTSIHKVMPEDKLNNTEIKLTANLLDENGSTINECPELNFEDSEDRIYDALLNGNGDVEIELSGSDILNKKWIDKVVSGCTFSIKSSINRIKKTDFKPNEEILTESGLSVTFLKIAEDKELGYYDKADEGNYIRSVQVLVTNNTDETITLSPYDFRLQDGFGNRYSSDFTQGKKPSLTSEDIRPGRNQKGWVEFEQSPIEAKDFTIEYSPEGETFYIDF